MTRFMKMALYALLAAPAAMLVTACKLCLES
jgi:hypothetical protein